EPQSSENQDNSPEIANEIEASNDELFSPEVQEVLKDIPKEKRQTLISAIMMTKHHSGPLPDGETMEKYNELIPRGAERLMEMLEKKVDAGIKHDETNLKRTLNQRSRGQWMGFILVLVMTFVGYSFAEKGHEALAMVIFGGEIGILAGIFVLGKFIKSSSNED
ncbi:hypothetical protein, partial [Aquirufa aurantiipilula]